MTRVRWLILMEGAKPLLVQGLPDAVDPRLSLPPVGDFVNHQGSKYEVVARHWEYVANERGEASLVVVIAMHILGPAESMA